MEFWIHLDRENDIYYSLTIPFLSNMAYEGDGKSTRIRLRLNAHDLDLGTTLIEKFNTI